MKTLRLILGDQLNYQHSWYEQQSNETFYFLAEMRQETDYVTHHIQKVVGFFESMCQFANWLEGQGHKVIYYQIDHPDNKQSVTKNLDYLIETHGIEKFEYQLPDEYRLDKQLTDYCQQLDIASNSFDTEHFMSDRDSVDKFFEGKKERVMEYFYRDMRKRHGIMMLSDSQPEGGKWNFDKQNRKKWKGEPSIPEACSFANNTAKTVERIKQAGIETIGHIDPDNFNWPVNRDQSLRLLDYFCSELLEYFGDYQDAMHSDQHFLFHSRLSFALNCKMLHPREVVDKVIKTWRQQEDRIAISQVEGFVRQIIGWREFMRGIYWSEMPEYENLNELDNSNALPDFFWSGETRMNCLKHAIDQSLEEAYAHHIQRLMITGNFALLAQCDPDEVDRWYLGIYADAIQWVQLPNTRGMSQFADGSIVATKPYVSSANYINKMSDYCGSCVYNHKEKTTEDACPFNSLYWNFLDEKKTYFRENRRMGMMLNLLEKKSAEELSAIKKRAQEILSDPSRF